MHKFFWENYTAGAGLVSNSLMPNEEIVRRFEYDVELSDSMYDSEKATLVVMIGACVVYRSASNAPKHDLITGRSFLLTWEDSENEVHHLLGPGSLTKNPARLGVESFDIGQTE